MGPANQHCWGVELTRELRNEEIDCGSQRLWMKMMEIRNIIWKTKSIGWGSSNIYEINKYENSEKPHIFLLLISFSL
jgi:hypothetical protein